MPALGLLPEFLSLTMRPFLLCKLVRMKRILRPKFNTNLFVSDDTYGAVFLNAISRSTPVTSRIIRINLNDPNFDTFGVFSFPSGITVNTGDLDPRNNKFQMMYINTAGDTVSMVRTASKYPSYTLCSCFLQLFD